MELGKIQAIVDLVTFVFHFLEHEVDTPLALRG
jgi:hypothetical protein